MSDTRTAAIVAAELRQHIASSEAQGCLPNPATCLTLTTEAVTLQAAEAEALAARVEALEAAPT